jgi:hypothetical protein
MQGVQRGQRCGLEQDKQLVCPERERGGGGGRRSGAVTRRAVGDRRVLLQAGGAMYPNERVRTSGIL